LIFQSTDEEEAGTKLRALWWLWLVDDGEVMSYPVHVTDEVSISSVKHSYARSYDDC
jgi:hypothetical protein